MRNLSMLILVISLFSLSSCKASQELDAIAADSDAATNWTFIHFNVNHQNGEMESYYYYGRVASRLYQLIAGNQLHSGFIRMRDVRYWGNDDKVYAYRNEEDSGELVFRIEDIQRIKLLQAEPKITGGLANEQKQPANQLVPAGGA